MTAAVSRSGWNDAGAHGPHYLYLTFNLKLAPAGGFVKCLRHMA
jgi:hypothetical protein